MPKKNKNGQKTVIYEFLAVTNFWKQSIFYLQKSLFTKMNIHKNEFGYKSKISLIQLRKENPRKSPRAPPIVPMIVLVSNSCKYSLTIILLLT